MAMYSVVAPSFVYINDNKFTGYFYHGPPQLNFLLLDWPGLIISIKKVKFFLIVVTISKDFARSDTQHTSTEGSIDLTNLQILVCQDTMLYFISAWFISAIFSPVIVG